MKLSHRLVPYLAVGIGGFLGAIARYGVNSLCGQVFETAFPVGTFVINISGSLFLGWFLTLLANRLAVPERADLLRLAVAVGFVGAYTTFSTFSFESNAMLEKEATLASIVNMVGSVVVGLVAVRAGAWLAR